MKRAFPNLGLNVINQSSVAMRALRWFASLGWSIEVMSRAPHRVEWLTDNGSCFAAKQTVEFASWLGLFSRFTPVRSPVSNGMAEAFVKTFKRDYVYVNDRPDAQTVLSQLATWFEDYNEMYPHKGLRMLSPREFIRLSATVGCPV